MASPIAHQDNFGTNLTSNQTSGVTTTPLNSIPGATAPFYMAFDATNTNSNYERVLVTSKTATHVNHAATSYAHTTAEEVRMVNPALEFDLIYQPPQGYLYNGKISVTDAAGITVAIKTLAGTDPSVSDPVYCRIGDTVRSITAALSVSAADGTNWFASGATKLATLEIDYFAYLGYNATDGVVIGFSRVIGNKYGDFSATTTNEKFCKISTITTAAATDYYEVIGRFAATLSATAAFTWSVPTYTAANLIQRPIYETRWLTVTPALAWTAGVAPSNPSVQTSQYKVIGDTVFVSYSQTFTAGTTVTLLTASYPFAPSGGTTYPIAGNLANVTAMILSYCYIDGNNFVIACGSSTLDRFFISGGYKI